VLGRSPSSLLLCNVRIDTDCRKSLVQSFTLGQAGLRVQHDWICRQAYKRWAVVELRYRTTKMNQAQQDLRTIHISAKRYTPTTRIRLPMLSVCQKLLSILLLAGLIFLIQGKGTSSRNSRLSSAPQRHVRCKYPGASRTSFPVVPASGMNLESTSIIPHNSINTCRHAILIQQACKIN